MNIFGKKYKITNEKKEELEKELKNLQTKGRKEVADKLSWLREQLNDEEDDPFGELLEDKNFLEKRISEIKEILNNCSIVDHKTSVKKIDIGSIITVGVEGFEETYTLVSSIEADPLKKKISDESPIGKSLLGAKVGDEKSVKVGNILKKLRIINIK